jgi:hypothetical protein
MRPDMVSAVGYFLFVVLVAILWRYAGPPLLVVAAVVFFLIGWVKFAQRFPMTAIAIAGFLSGLLGGGGGRRRW